MHCSVLCCVVLCSFALCLVAALCSFVSGYTLLRGVVRFCVLSCGKAVSLCRIASHCVVLCCAVSCGIV